MESTRQRLQKAAAQGGDMSAPAPASGKKATSPKSRKPARRAVAKPAEAVRDEAATMRRPRREPEPVVNTSAVAALSGDDVAGDGVPRRGRRRRAHTVQAALQLEAPPRAGFVRRFVANTPKRIHHMKQLGYDLVNDKAGEGNARTSGVGTRIERHAGTDEEGAPYGLILMETPVEEYQYGVEDKEAVLKPFEEAIRQGKDTTGRLQDQYKPSEGSSIS